jgi:DNA-binding MarR family transcriptional regulator
MPATADELRSISRIFAPLPVEIITRIGRRARLQEKSRVTPESIRTLVARRPSTAEEIAGMTGLTINEASAALSALTASGFITTYTVGSRTFFRTFS